MAAIEERCDHILDDEIFAELLFRKKLFFEVVETELGNPVIPGTGVDDVLLTGEFVIDQIGRDILFLFTGFSQ